MNHVRPNVLSPGIVQINTMPPYNEGAPFCDMIMLTLTVLVATVDAQWERMGDVGSARYEAALLSPWHKGFKLQ